MRMYSSLIFWANKWFASLLYYMPKCLVHRSVAVILVVFACNFSFFQLDILYFPLVDLNAHRSNVWCGAEPSYVPSESKADIFVAVSKYNVMDEESDWAIEWDRKDEKRRCHVDLMHFSERKLCRRLWFWSVHMFLFSPFRCLCSHSYYSFGHILLCHCCSYRIAVVFRMHLFFLLFSYITFPFQRSS